MAWVDADNFDVTQQFWMAMTESRKPSTVWATASSIPYGAPLLQYVYGRGVDKHIQLREVTSEQEFYYHCNSQGFVGVLTDTNQLVIEYYEYSWLGRLSIFDSNGVTTIAVSRANNPYMFQGRRYDPETSHHYYRNRYYSPHHGRIPYH